MQVNPTYQSLPSHLANETTQSSPSIASPLTRVASPSHPNYGSQSSLPYSPDDVSSKNTTPTSSKPKQRRNKPTLSCIACVDRKTKCDRTRPICGKCASKQLQCSYTPVANLLASQSTTHSAKLLRVHKVKSSSSSRPLSISPTAATEATKALVDAVDQDMHQAQSSTSAPGMAQPSSAPPNGSRFSLANVPAATSTPSNIFGIGKQYPFSNYWTCSGGIAEVIGVLPSKDQADMFFEAMHPVYPFLHRRSFYARYERFWSLSPAEKLRADSDMLALHYTVYALGTQFMALPSYDATASSAEFYASASNQALRIYSYLNRASIESLSAMLMLTYFLKNDNHASDAFAWSGSLLRQAYALKLNRDPEIVVPNASQMEKHARRKLWQAVFFTDTFLTVLLRLPPCATHADVEPDSLVDEATLIAQGTNIEAGMSSRVENLMSISVIAPPQDSTIPSTPIASRFSQDPMVDKRDIEYIKSMWKLGIFVQQNIASPVSLDQPIVSAERPKPSLMAAMHSLHAAFPPDLTNLDEGHLQALVAMNPRLARQNLFLNSNYYHCLMLLAGAANHDAGIDSSIQDTLEAAHAAIGCFCKLWRYFESEAGTWWVFHHRAFDEALTIAKILSTTPNPSMDPIPLQQLYIACKSDIIGVIDLIRRCDNGNSEMQKGRLDMLEKAVESVFIL